MIYRIRHETVYHYEDPVLVSHHIVRLTPRNTPLQKCVGPRISVMPKPPKYQTHADYFGNGVTLFTLIEPHQKLTVDATAEIEVSAPGERDFSASRPWERVRDLLAGPKTNDAVDASQFVYDSRRVFARRNAAADVSYSCAMLQSVSPCCTVCERLSAASASTCSVGRLVVVAT